MNKIFDNENLLWINRKSSNVLPFELYWKGRIKKRDC